MKLTRKLLLAGLAVAAAVACQPTPAELKIETFERADSTDHVHMSMNAELPVPSKGPASLIRAKLIEVMDDQLTHIASYGDDVRIFPSFEGYSNDSKALIDYYWNQSMEAFGEAAEEDYAERVASVDENDGLTDEDRDFILFNMPKWEYDFSLIKTDETDRYVVFVSEDYTYLGGAHGGIVGHGPLTFDKKTGELVETFLDPGCLKEIQPLIKKGLVEYFSDYGEEIGLENIGEFLITDSETIPFPAWCLFPSEKGLGFLYQQYEIAPYSAGMPGFTLSYDDILPYLTPEAKSILGL